MKIKNQLITTVLCTCILFSLAACGKAKPTTLSEPSPSAETTKNNIPPFLEDDIDDPDYPYVCNHTNNLYHLTSCPEVSSQKSKIFTYYKTEESAKQSGYTPCKKCLL